MAIKRKHGLLRRDRLTDESLKEFNSLFEFVLDGFEMNEVEKDLARKLIPSDDYDDDQNKKIFKPSNSINFSLLDNFFLNMS